MEAMKSYDELQIDMEINLDLFGKIRPDICIVERSPEIQEYLKCLRSNGKMHYLIEVKKETQKSNDSEYNYHFKNVKTNIPQSKSIEQISTKLQQNMD